MLEHGAVGGVYSSAVEVGLLVFGLLILGRAAGDEVQHLAVGIGACEFLNGLEFAGRQRGVIGHQFSKIGGIHSERKVKLRKINA